MNLQIFSHMFRLIRVIFRLNLGYIYIYIYLFIYLLQYRKKRDLIYNKNLLKYDT